MKARSYIWGIIFLTGLMLGSASALAKVHAATLNFDPTSINVKVGETFEVDMIVDTGTAEVTGVDSLFEFNAGIIEAQSISDGTFLEVNHQEIREDGKVYVVGLVNSPGEAVQGKDVLSTVTFKAKAAGTTNMSYLCEINDTRESNISENSTDAPDIIECSSNGKTVVVVTGGTPTSAPGGSSSSKTGGTSSSSELPKSGVFDHFGLIVIIGGLLCAIGIGARRFI